MLRVDCESSSVCADQLLVVEMAPVMTSMVRATSSPVQATVLNCAMYTALSPATGCRVLVAAAEEEPITALMDCSALPSSVTTASGFFALRLPPFELMPCPLTAACHRSSMRCFSEVEAV